MASVPGLQRNRVLLAAAVCMSLFLACGTPLLGSQKDQKKKKNKATADNSATSVIPMTDEEKIDYLISEVLGAWQIGDVERMHKDYADDVSVVNGGWAPPVMGWAKYAQLYKQEQARMQQVRLDRSNTYIWVNGNTAWACYQWDFSAVVDGQVTGARGLTTLVLKKQNDRWLIVHDHSNVVQTAPGKPPAEKAPPAQSSQQEKPGA